MRRAAFALLLCPLIAGSVLAQAGGESGAPTLSGLTPAIKERIDAIIASLRQRSTPAVQLAQGRDLE